MDPKEVREIFGDVLATKNIQEALIGAYQKIALQILEKLFSRAEISNESSWEVVKSIVHAQSWLCLFTALPSDEKSGLVETTASKEAVEVYRTWLKVVSYYCDNFDLFSNHDSLGAMGREGLLQAKDIISTMVEEYTKESVTTEIILFPLYNFRLMAKIFGWMLKVILGKEAHEEYSKEFDVAVATLKQCEAEFSIMITETPAVN